MKSKRYWIIALGKQSFFWEECKKKGFIVIGWDKCGDTSRFNSYEDVKQALMKSKRWGYMTPQETGRVATQIWNFGTAMDNNHVVVVRRGQSTILGIGKVESKQCYNPSKLSPEVKKAYFGSNDYDAIYPNIRNVTWLTSFPPEGIEISKHQDWLRTLIEIKDEKLEMLLSELKDYDISLDKFDE
jgi:hypothetical protein